MSKKKKKPKPQKPVVRLQNKHPPLPIPLRMKYDAAQTTVENMKHWSLADSLSADAASTPEVRRTLRNRARYEVASNPGDVFEDFDFPTGCRFLDFVFGNVWGIDSV